MHAAPLAGAGAIGLAIAVAQAPLASVQSDVVMAPPSEIATKLDGRFEEVYGTGLGGLAFASTRFGANGARVTIRHIRTGEEIACSVQAADELGSSGAASRIASSCDRKNFPGFARLDGTISVAEPLVLQYVKAAANGEAYDTMAVANEILRQQGAANPALLFAGRD